jgi:3-dehydroquinate synthase
MLVRVALAQNPYNVHVGAGILAQVGEITRRALRHQASKAFLATDSGVPAAAVETVAASLADCGLPVTRSAITPSEAVKTLETFHGLLQAMARSKHERCDPVVALGGGIVGDIAGFAAAAYQRGVPVVQCPTTLLAMVDASVGGKTAVNLDLGTDGLHKNMVGAFWQPAAVVADVQVLASLPPRHLRAGLAECLKHALICRDLEDPDLLEWIGAHIDQALALHGATLEELVARNVSAKARIVRGDERERAPEGGRSLLNLGHTFAHAIETLPGLFVGGTPGPLLHGEAVGLGLIAASTCSSAMGLAPPGFPGDVAALIRRVNLPATVQGLPPTPDVLARMAHDKKARAGALRLVLPTGDGKARIISNPPVEAITAGLDAIRA